MAHRASTSNTGGNVAPTVAVPSGVAANDIIIVAVEIDDATYTISTHLPSGFAMLFTERTLAPDGGKAGVFWKRASGADTGTYALTASTTHSWAMACSVFSGRSTTSSPVANDTNHTTGASSPVSITAPTVTALSGDDLMWIGMPDVTVASAGNRDAPPTSPGTFTERVDVEDTFDGFSNITTATLDNVSAGATGSVTGTFTLTSGQAGWDAVLIRIPSASSVVDLTLTPGAANTNFAGSTPSVLVDITRSPAVANTAWSGSTPSVNVDITRSPAAANVDWSGSTPSLLFDATRSPGAANVTWAGSTPSVIVDLTLSPAAADVEWAGSTPTLVADDVGDLTLMPAAGAVDWAGSTPTVVVVPDPVIEPVPEGGHALFEDFTRTEPKRDLILKPGAASMFWNGARPTVVVEEPPRPRLPGPFRFLIPDRPAAPAVVDLDLAPGPAAVTWAGSRPDIAIENYVPETELHAAQGRITELEARVRDLEEEEAVILAALSAG